MLFDARSNKDVVFGVKFRTIKLTKTNVLYEGVIFDMRTKQPIYGMLSANENKVREHISQYIRQNLSLKD